HRKVGAKCGSESGDAPSAQGTVRTTYADIPGVLARGEAIAADAAEHRGAVFAAEQPRYFLLNLHHPVSALGLVVIERDPEVREEGPDLGSVLVETLEQIPGLGFFLWAALLRPG
ncbi:MAG: hypothetical protein RL077_2182, partial [Verrucomicrobiota bacterium]